MSVRFEKRKINMGETLAWPNFKLYHDVNMCNIFTKGQKEPRVIWNPHFWWLITLFILPSTVLTTMFSFQLYWEVIVIYHSINFRYTTWFTHIVKWQPQWFQLTSVFSYRYNKKKKGNNVSPCDANSSIYSLNIFPVFYTAVLAVIITYVTSLVLIF